MYVGNFKRDEPVGGAVSRGQWSLVPRDESICLSLNGWKKRRGHALCHVIKPWTECSSPQLLQKPSHQTPIQMESLTRASVNDVHVWQPLPAAPGVRRRPHIATTRRSCWACCSMEEAPSPRGLRSCLSSLSSPSGGPVDQLGHTHTINLAISSGWSCLV